MRLLLWWTLALPVTSVVSLGLSVMPAPKPTILSEYQTLLAGLLALGSAVVAAILLHQQTRQARELENERRLGQREAARSWLSLHVSSIIRYADGMGKGVYRLIEQCQGEALPKDAEVPKFPELPMDAAIAVKEFAAFATADEAKFLALMFSSMQVLESRIRGMIEEPGGKVLSNLEAYLEDAAELYARAEALLGYARHSTPKFPSGATWERYSGAMFLITHSHEPTDRIGEHIKKGAAGNMRTFLPNRFERDPD